MGIRVRDMSRPYDVDNKQVICKAGAIGFETLGFEPALPACGAGSDDLIWL